MSDQTTLSDDAQWEFDFDEHIRTLRDDQIAEATGLRRRFYYRCKVCKNRTYTDGITDRRKLGLCADCYKRRCSFCDGEFVITLLLNNRYVFYLCSDCDTSETHDRILEIVTKGRYDEFVEEIEQRRAKELEHIEQALLGDTTIHGGLIIYV